MQGSHRHQFASFGGELVGRVDELTDVHLERMGGDIPAWMREPGLWEGVRSFGRASILAELETLRDGARLPERCPEVDAEGARDAARNGLPLDLMLSGYRRGNEVQWDAWFDLVDREAEDPAERRELLRGGSRFFFDYADRLSRFVTEEYTRERERALRSSEQRRVLAVRELLDGGDPGPAALDWELQASHLALVASGPEAGEAIRELSIRLDRRLLLVAVRGDVWWAWLSGDRPLGDRVRELPGSAWPADALVGAGSEARGLEGFRASHFQAVHARSAGSGPVTLYEDVALEALASIDGPQARAFAKRELHGIDGSDARSRRLRETLAAWFAAGQNAASAAAALKVHEHTVARRLQAVEERIGRPVASRRAELETALRLRSWLGLE